MGDAEESRMVPLNNVYQSELPWRIIFSAVPGGIWENG